jgi:hypothetical protein
MKRARPAAKEQQEEHSRLTREAMADVDASQIIDHQRVQAWVNSLGSDQPLPMPKTQP